MNDRGSPKDARPGRSHGASDSGPVEKATGEGRDDSESAKGALPTPPDVDRALAEARESARKLLASSPDLLDYDPDDEPPTGIVLQRIPELQRELRSLNPPKGETPKPDGGKDSGKGASED